VIVPETAPVATTSKATWATLTTFVGPSSRVFWNAVRIVVPVANDAGFAMGAPNSGLPPAVTDAIVRMLGS
jgi:hypothetical protein